MSDLLRELHKFGWIGGVGFLVDAALLTALAHGLGWSPYTSRLVSFCFAVTATWLLNRTFVFRARRPGQGKIGEFSRYVLVQSTGALVNLCVYAAFIELVPSSRQFLLIPLAAGSAVALFFNFFAARLWVYARPR